MSFLSISLHLYFVGSCDESLMKRLFSPEVVPVPLFLASVICA